jgi:GNAT superfamily N-acetyltransferase
VELPLPHERAHRVPSLLLALPRIPERDLERFVNVDHHDREAFVVVSGPRIMASAATSGSATTRRGRGRVVVEDAHQGRGIGSVLLEHLADAARENGITRFVAEVLPENGGMLRVFSDFGYRSSAATPTAWCT